MEKHKGKALSTCIDAHHILFVSLKTDFSIMPS